MVSALPESKDQSTPTNKRDMKAEAQTRVLYSRFLTKGGNGVATAVTAAAVNVTITLPLVEVDALYGVVAVPNWSTTVYVTNKTTTSFKINFGTAAPASSTVDWIVFRAR